MVGTSILGSGNSHWEDDLQMFCRLSDSFQTRTQIETWSSRLEACPNSCSMPQNKKNFLLSSKQDSHEQWLFPPRQHVNVEMLQVCRDSRQLSCDFTEATMPVATSRDTCMSLFETGSVPKSFNWTLLHPYHFVTQRCVCIGICKYRMRSGWACELLSVHVRVCSIIA